MQGVGFHAGPFSKPRLDYLEDLPEDERARVAAAVAVISKYGLREAPVDLRQIESKLWEIKVHSHRVFYVVHRQEVVLLHAYKKQGQKAPRRDVEVARRRLGEFLAREDQGE